MTRQKQALCKTLDELMQFYFPKASASQRREDKQASDAIRNAAGQDKASIRLRGKKQSQSISLFLDQYKGIDTKREYEFLKMYLNIETSTAIKDANRATMEVAERILAERKDNLLLKGIGIVKKVKTHKSLRSFIDQIAEEKLKEKNLESLRNGEDMKVAERRNKRSSYYVLKCVSKHLEVYRPKANIDQVNLKFVRGWLEYLKTAKNFNFLRNEDPSKNTDVYLSSNTQLHLYNAFNNVMNEAVRRNLLEVNPCSLITRKEKPKEVKGTRTYLDAEEVKLLMKTKCKTPEMKRAFLFCCFEGLRFSDVSTLKWGDISKDYQGDLVLNKVMQKTKIALESHPILEPALPYLGERGKASDDDLIFHLGDDETTNYQLKRWVKAAGIKKKITFHCSRHTAATLALSYGCAPQVVMTLLGHTKLDMTLRYAKQLKAPMKQDLNKVADIFR